MLKLDISGMADGEYEFNIVEPVSLLNSDFEEFIGDVVLDAIMNKLGNRYNLKADIKATAKMICDRSLQEYEEQIKSHIDMSFIADTKAFLSMNGKEPKYHEVIIREDIKYIDITTYVMESLALELPMKRIAPQFRDKQLDEIYPDVADKISSEKHKDLDERWSKLKNLKIN